MSSKKTDQERLDALAAMPSANQFLMQAMRKRSKNCAWRALIRMQRPHG